MAPGSGFMMNCGAIRARQLGANGNRAQPSSTVSRSRPRKRGAARLRCRQEDQRPQTPSARRRSWVGPCCRRPSGRCSGPGWCAPGAGAASAHLHAPAIDLGRWWLCWATTWLGSQYTDPKSAEDGNRQANRRCPRFQGASASMGCRAHVRLAWTAAPPQQGLRVPACHERDHHLHHDDRPHDSQTGSGVGLFHPPNTGGQPRVHALQKIDLTPSPSPGRRGEQDASSRSNRLCRVADKHACPDCQDLRPPRRAPCDATVRQQNGSSGRCCGTDRSCAPSSDASIPSDHLSSISSASKLASLSRPMVPLTSPGRHATAAGMLGLLLRASWFSGFPIT